MTKYSVFHPALHLNRQHGFERMLCPLFLTRLVGLGHWSSRICRLNRSRRNGCGCRLCEVEDHLFTRLDPRGPFHFRRHGWHDVLFRHFRNRNRRRGFCRRRCRWRRCRLLHNWRRWWLESDIGLFVKILVEYEIASILHHTWIHPPPPFIASHFFPARHDTVRCG